MPSTAVDGFGDVVVREDDLFRHKVRCEQVLMVRSQSIHKGKKHVAPYHSFVERLDDANVVVEENIRERRSADQVWCAAMTGVLSEHRAPPPRLPHHKNLGTATINYNGVVAWHEQRSGVGKSTVSVTKVS
ncbi:glutathionylspermidine synthase, putative [Leishmania tarentolae]|uniref:Glutathionylspermidine synthase, putative n=1 Tax=Leishmania tarentolae TaxID=5689 RepID=A0A640KI07_LEITA|nr:glutathionylspermidine synthase, putative [Leishmania tarentolae]